MVGKKGEQRDVTVLAKYQRLESEGIWRFDETEQRRDIIVSIGKATITISAANGTALTHWSLPAIERLNPGAMPALYRPGPESSEVLELADEEMVRAVDRVLGSLHRRQGSRPPLRRYGVPVLALALIAAMVVWLPDAIIPQLARNSSEPGGPPRERFFALPPRSATVRMPGRMTRCGPD